jgi:phage terminase large subunit-like protein
MTAPTLDTYRERLAYLALLEEQVRRTNRRKLWTYYPTEGPLRRELYRKHLAFFAAGGKHRERLMLAANRVGKTEGVGVYELVLHLTGFYPEWWDAVGGRRFHRPIVAWTAGDTGKTVRDILQFKLLGKWGEFGTGVLPGDALVSTTTKQGIGNAVETVTVRHITGGVSSVTLKSYDQRREAFQGTEVDVILLDEEPPLDIYTECLLRTMTNNGMLMLTFTPLMGMSDVVLEFLPSGSLEQGAAEGKFVVMATWDDVPHLSEAVKAELYKAIPPFQRDARSKGVPQLGAGAIYPVPESEIVIPDLSGGRLKVFKSMQNWLAEYRMYRRDDKGHVVKANDHAMDATRYLVVSGLDRAAVKPVAHYGMDEGAPTSLFGLAL